MKKFLSLGIIVLLVFTMPAGVVAAEDKKRNCAVEHFIGTGETMDLSFSVCKDVIASPTFLQSFSMNCQHGLVTYALKDRPSAKYLRLGNDGRPVHCSST